MHAATPKENREETDASGAPVLPEPSNAADAPTPFDDADEQPQAPFVVLTGLATARYNGRIGQIVSPVTDDKGVDRWVVRLYPTEQIRVPVDKCIRVTANEITQWKLDQRRDAERAELAARGDAEVEDPEAEMAEVDTTPFPPPLRTYVFAMDNFFGRHLTTGEDVQVYEFAKLFDQFEVEVCKAVASDVGDADITEDVARKALGGHMSRSARYEAAFNRYVRLVETVDGTPPTEGAYPVTGAPGYDERVAAELAKATLDDGPGTPPQPSAPSDPRSFTGGLLSGRPSPVPEEASGVLV